MNIQNLSVRIAAGCLGALIAATLAHLFIGELVMTIAGAVFFGFGVGITIGSGGHDGGGGDAGGG